MSKGKTKTGSRSGSDSNNGSRASASDRRHAQQKVREGKSLQAGTEQSGKRQDGQAGGKGESRR